MSNEEVMQKFIKNYENGFYKKGHITEEREIRQAIEIFENSIVSKITNNEELTELENRFKNVVLDKWYDENGYIYNNTANVSRLSEPYKKIFVHYLNNFSNIKENEYLYCIKFLALKMCKEEHLKIQRIKFDEGEDLEDFQIINGRTANAFHSNDGKLNYVLFNPRMVKYHVNKKSPHLFETILHELEHEVQKVLMNTNKLINIEAIIWARELVIRTVLGDDYYNINYKDIFHERDARFVASMKLEKILEELGVNRKSGVYPRKNVNDQFSTSVHHKNTKQEEYPTQDDLVATDTLDILCNEIIKKYPYLLNNNQVDVLNIIYDKKANKKTLYEIYAELDEKMQQELNSTKEEIKQEEIKKTYKTLKMKLPQIDNEYRFQQIILEIKRCREKGLDASEKTYITLLNNLIKIRTFSMEKCIEHIEKYKLKLKKEYDKSKKSGNKDEFVRLQEKIRYLSDIEHLMLMHNEDFRNEKEQALKKIEIEESLYRDTGINLTLTESKFQVDKSGIVYVTEKTDDEINKTKERFLNQIESLRKTLGNELTDKYKKYVEEYYKTKTTSNQLM